MKSPRGKKKIKGKLQKEWRKKGREKTPRKEAREDHLPMREILESLGRIENKIKSVEMKNKTIEKEMDAIRNRDLRDRENERINIDVDSEAERIQEVFQRVDKEQEHDDRWRAIQSEYKGKDGTAKLKEWCQKNEIPYKNKDNAMMAVLAAEGEVQR